MQRKIALGIVSVSALVFILLIVDYANAGYPIVGHDFSYFIPHLIDSYLHYRMNGLSIQWYSPTFAGGLPAYPNPQNMQFTLPELLLTVLDPWNAALVASAIYILIGFLSAYYFLDRIAGFSPLASALGAIFFNINGFIFMHTITGQLGYQGFPLLPVLLIALSHPKLAPLLRGVMASAVLAILIHSGGFYTIVIFGLSLTMTIPALLLMRPRLFSEVKLLPMLFWTILFTALLTGSKLFAVRAFMAQFPRIQEDHYGTGLLIGLYGILLQFVQSSIIYPVLKLAGPKLSRNLSHYIGYVYRTSGTQYGLWEFDASLSPALILLLVFGPFFLHMLHKDFKPRIERRQLGLLALLLVGGWITTEFRLTDGLIYPHLQGLPILASLHVNLRFAAAYILPLSLAGAWTFQQIQQRLDTRLGMAVCCVAASLTLLAPVSYLAIPVSTLEYLYNIQPSIQAYNHIQAGETYPIQYLMINPNLYTENLILANASDLNPYEPVLGYKLEDFHPQTHVGPVTDQSNGYFNLTNPASLLYPGENQLNPFERIKVSDRKNLESFVNHGMPDWQLPLIQRILDTLMGLSFGAGLMITSGYLLVSLVAAYRARASLP